MERLKLGLVGLAATAAACAMDDGLDPIAPTAPIGAVQADVREPGGRLVASSTATQVGDSIRVRIEAAGLAQGVYGMHIHDVGRCDSPDFQSAGSHWNPTGREHGIQNPLGQHKGDLPNLMVGTGGAGSLEYTIPNAWLADGDLALLDGNGAALVIHVTGDDYRTDPSGNSGARIACGVFG